MNTLCSFERSEFRSDMNLPYTVGPTRDHYASNSISIIVPGPTGVSIVLSKILRGIFCHPNLNLTSAQHSILSSP